MTEKGRETVECRQEKTAGKHEERYGVVKDEDKKEF